MTRRTIDPSSAPAPSLSEARMPRNFSDKIGRAVDKVANVLYPDRKDKRLAKAEQAMKKEAADLGAQVITPEAHRMNLKLQTQIISKLPCFFTDRGKTRPENTPRFSFRMEFDRQDAEEFKSQLGLAMSKTPEQRRMHAELTQQSGAKCVVAFELSEDVSNKELKEILEKIHSLYTNHRDSLDASRQAEKDSLNDVINTLAVSVSSLDQNSLKGDFFNAKTIIKEDPTATVPLEPHQGVLPNVSCSQNPDQYVTEMVALAIKNRFEGKLIVENAQLHGLRTEACPFSSIELTNVISSKNNWSGLNLEPQGLKLINVSSYLDCFYGKAPEATISGTTFYGLNYNQLDYNSPSKTLVCTKNNIDMNSVCFTYDRAWNPLNEHIQESPWRGGSILGFGLARFLFPKRINSILPDSGGEPGRLEQELDSLAEAAKNDGVAKRKLKRFLNGTLFYKSKLPENVQSILSKDVIDIYIKHRDGTTQSFNTLRQDLSFLSTITAENEKVSLSVMTRITALNAKFTPLFNEADESIVDLSFASSKNKLMRGDFQFFAGPEGIVELARIMGEFERRFKKIASEDIRGAENAAADAKRQSFEANTWLHEAISSRPEFFRPEASRAPKPQQKAPEKVA